MNSMWHIIDTSGGVKPRSSRRLCACGGARGVGCASVWVLPSKPYSTSAPVVPEVPHWTGGMALFDESVFKNPIFMGFLKSA